MNKFILLCFYFLLSTSLVSQTKSGAMIVSEDFVKSVLNYPSTAKFPLLSQSVESSSLRKFIVLGEVEAKNAFGTKSEMVYKIWLEYQSGDETLMNSWTCSKIILEDRYTRKQSIFYPSKGKNQKKVVVSTKGITFLGMNCKIIEQSSLFIRIQTPRKLSKSEIEKGIKTFEQKNKIVSFHLVGKTKRGEEYAQMQNAKHLFYY